MIIIFILYCLVTRRTFECFLTMIKSVKSI